MLRRKKKQTEADTALAEVSATDAEGAAAPPPRPSADGGPGDAAIAMAEAPDAAPPPPAPEPLAPEPEMEMHPEPEMEMEPEPAMETESYPEDWPAPTPPPASAKYRPSPDRPPEGDFVERLPVGFYFDGVVKPERVRSREELEREAEAEFQAAVAPSLAALRELVPDASSPQEAMEVLASQQGEALVDEEGASLTTRDIYKNDASVYYRIRRHFEKPPRRGITRDWKPPAGLAPSRRELPSARRSSR